MKIEMTDTDLRKLLKTWGYMLRKDGDEYEVYPKGQRGVLSYFTHDRDDALATAEREAKGTFESEISFITYEGVQQALIEWHDTFRASWKEALFTAWWTGNYGRFNHTTVSSTLQKLRNSQASEVINLINY